MWPMSKWPLPHFAAGSIVVLTLVVFVNYSLAVGTPGFPLVAPTTYAQLKAAKAAAGGRVALEEMVGGGGSLDLQYKQAGNCVPPPLAAALGVALRKVAAMCA